MAEIDGQDVSSAVYEGLCCISKWLEKVQSMHSQVESTSDEPFGETVQDPTYIPEESDGSETGEEGVEYEKTGPSTSAKQPGKPISIKLNFSRKSKKRPKAETAEASDTPSSPSKKKKMAPQSVMEPQTVGPPDATSTSHTTPATQSKCRSHHKKSKCPYCSKQLFDLKWHLRMHAKNDDNNIQTRGIIFSPNAVNPSSNRESSNANESMLHFADENNINQFRSSLAQKQ